MTRDEAARAIGVAVTEIKSADETEHGTVVVMSNGARRLIVPGDGFYALDDHSDNARLRRWSPPEGADQDREVPAGGGSEPLDVPDGTVGEVLAWVGTDHQRATAALEAEWDRDPVRFELFDALKDFVPSRAVPDGSVADVLEWVGEDGDRALAALAYEKAKASPRKSLIERLEKL